MSGLQIAYLVVLGVCLTASGFFSGSETALVGIQRERVHQLAQSGGRRGERLESLTADPDRMLSTLLVANNFVNILAASVATALFIDLTGESWGPWIATAVLTAFILVIGEIGPKTLAARYPEAFSLFVAPTVWRLGRFLAPISRVFVGITRAIFRMLGLRLEPHAPGVTEDDIRAMALLGERTGDIEPEERAIIDSLFRLADRPVREVMTPRVDIVALNAPVTVDTAREAVASTGHSRFLVTGESLDHVVGVLAVKDLLRRNHDVAPDEIAPLLRQPHYVPESLPVSAALSDMRAHRVGFAVVVDEHGGVEGIVTAKDLVGELVGEMQDEFDPGTPTIMPVGHGRWLMDGRVPLEEVEEAVGRALPRGHYSTAGGLILDLAGRVPSEGDAVTTDGLEMTVVRMDRNRVARIRVEARS